MSAYLAVCASGTVLFLFVYFSEELGQTLFLSLSQRHMVPLASYQLLHLGKRKNNKNHYLSNISILFQNMPFSFLTSKTNSGDTCSESCDIPQHLLDPKWTLTYLSVSLDKVLLFFLAFRRSTVAAFKLTFPGFLVTWFKWFCPTLWPLFTCQVRNTLHSKR